MAKQWKVQSKIKCKDFEDSVSGTQMGGEANIESSFYIWSWNSSVV